jgi:tRNA-specific 2-thiouridylase
MPPYPSQAMRHLGSPVGAGGLAHPDATGQAGAEDCGDVAIIDIAVADGHVTDAAFRVRGCGATTAAASAACERLIGASLDDAMRVSATALDADLGGLGPERRHGVDVAADAVTRALEAWYGARMGKSTHDPVPDTGRCLAPGRERLAVAMSGGVDSAVAAMLLVDQGYDVVGVTMRLWHDPVAARAERSCCAPETVRLARETCAALGIPHLVIDAAKRFRAEVVEDFIAGYRDGRTPNPCITCNGEVRFRILAEAAEALGAYGMATGHYARVDHSSGTAVLATAVDGTKDQSYMLARLTGDVLERLVLPLGDMTKDDVRALAASRGLPAADAVESQDVCFVGVGGYTPFLERQGVESEAGEIVDANGNVVGSHDGHWRYTVGQRKGLGIAAPEPLYVISTDAAANRVVVGTRADLAARVIAVEDVVAHDIPDRTLDVRIRHHGQPFRGRLVLTGDGSGEVVLEDAAEAVAPGQTAALYDGDRLVAAGRIAGAPAPGNRTED